MLHPTKTIQILIVTLFLIASPLFAEWKPAGDKLKTTWGEALNPKNVLPEYPRPIMEREKWSNLNGLWEYAIRPVGKAEPKKFDGDILVPFAVESSLSGVQKRLGKDNELWYKRTFKIPGDWEKKSVLLHFGAVDWKADVFVNDVKVGTHTGGYAPFSFDITPFLKAGDQKLVVKVWDPSDQGYQPRGKQVANPNHIWYTPVSGIWQTVWLEPVSAKYIKSVVATAYIDTNQLKFNVATNADSSDIIEVVLKDGANVVASAKFAANETTDLSIAEPKLWSTESPFLYDVVVKLYSNGQEQDSVTSYAAMRKVSTKKGKDGYVRLQLNNKDIFHFGLLDQGWWPDGLYTAPTDEALKYDIIKTKELGYNMIRKHAKTEPMRWYTHCDKIGLLVWQDMPNGDHGPKWDMYSYFEGKEAVRSRESEKNFKKEWKEIIDFLKPYPSIVTWVPFNEAWGQFKTPEIAEWTKKYDPSRLVNPASGGNHYKTGDMLDYHQYPSPSLKMLDTERVTVIGEYGGIGLPLEGHLWQTGKNWGYVQFKNAKEVTDEYEKYANMLYKLVDKGISAAVYTQTTDVEGEVNGLMTFDRKVMKVETERIKTINEKICNSLAK